MPDEEINGATATMAQEQQVPKLVATNLKKKSKVITVRLDDDTYLLLLKYIDTRHTDKSKAIRELIETANIDDAGE